MGMTIDEHKDHLIAIMDSMPDDTCGDWRDSLAFAVDTMRKYQKIAYLINQAEYAGENGYTGDSEWTLDGKTYRKIQEILKDGNAD